MLHAFQCSVHCICLSIHHQTHYSSSGTMRQLIHTNYLQAVSKITASKSTAISITLQGKSSTDDLSKLQPTQAHVVNYMKNKLPHMHIILDGENVKNNEI